MPSPKDRANKPSLIQKVTEQHKADTQSAVPEPVAYSSMSSIPFPPSYFSIPEQDCAIASLSLATGRFTFIAAEQGSFLLE